MPAITIGNGDEVRENNFVNVWKFIGIDRYFGRMKMSKLSFIVLAALISSASVTPAYADETGPHFFAADNVVMASGYGNINNNPCDATAVITVGPDTHNPSGSHVDHADYADVVFTNTSFPCSNYKVTARFYPNGDVSDVEVTDLGTATVICSSTGVYSGALTYVGNITDAYLNSPITVGACLLDTDISVDTGSISVTS